MECLKEENQDLHCKIESLEARNQDSLNMVMKVKQEKAEFEKQRLQKHEELQERITILEDALEAAKLIREQVEKNQISPSTFITNLISSCRKI